MCGIVTLEFNILSAQPESLFVVRHPCRWIVLITRSGKMEHRSPGWLVVFTRLPVSRYAATNSDNTAEVIRMGEGEAIVERARLGKTKQKYALRVGDAFADKCLP